MTVNNHYDIYLSNVKKLAKTICIKSEATANAFNQYLIDYFGPQSVNLNDPTTWRYYLNISGEYHPKDKLMYITSADTLETILFSKQNLIIHTSTAQSYQYGENKYKDLVLQYPDQELLIKGILYPADIDTAINAEDGKILSYPTELIEENEFTFLQNLQEWINGFKAFWTNKSYAVSNSLYHATNHAIMYACLIPVILNIRLKACKTNEAHSFHRRMYLGSHGYLDSYLDYLTLEQSLFLYRNILYISKNVGKQSTFDMLTDEILTKRGIPIARYKMKHDTSLLPDSLVPEVRFKKEDINIDVGEDNIFDLTTEQLLYKEDDSARYNKVNRPHYTGLINNRMANSRSSTVQTKVIESKMVDSTDSTPYPFADALINNWIYLSGLGHYNTYVSLDNPKTGELIEITAKEAYVLAFYCMLKQYDCELVEIPRFKFSRAQRVPNPSLAELKSVVTSKFVSDETLTNLLIKQPVLKGELFTTTMFYDHCAKISDAEMYHRILIANTEDSVARGMIDNAVSKMYTDGHLDLSDGFSTFNEWLTAKKINTLQFNVEDYAVVYQKLVTLTTGANFHTKLSMADIQKAMIAIMRQLSSYTVQYISNINVNNITVFDFASQRVSNIGEYSDTDLAPVVVDVYPFNDRIKTSVTSDISNNFQNVTDFGGTQNDKGSEVDVGIEFSKFMYNQSKHFQLANNIEIKLITDDNDLDLLDQESINNLARMLVSIPL